MLYQPFQVNQSLDILAWSIKALKS